MEYLRYVDGMYMRQDGTYSACLESLPPGVDPRNQSIPDAK